MHLLERSQTIAAPISEAFAFFSRPENLARITPPELRLRIAGRAPESLFEGARLTYRIRWVVLPLAWKTLITRWDPPREFQDRQERGPYRFWLHTHRFAPSPGGETLMQDRVEYELPLGPLGRAVDRLFVRRQLEATFDYRARAVARIFPRRPDAEGTTPRQAPGPPFARPDA